MSTYQVRKIENKGGDWKVATLIAPDNYPTENVSINRRNKQGEIFPNFDGIVEGGTVEGDLWKSSTPDSHGRAKWYLFAPKPLKTQNKAFGGGSGVKAAQERKAEMINQSQENKELGIKTSSTMRMAVDLALAEVGNNGDHEQYERRIEYWRTWCWDNWDYDPTSQPPF